MKWRFMIAIMKLKEGDHSEFRVEDMVNKLMDGQVKRYVERVEELEFELRIERDKAQLLRDELD